MRKLFLILGIFCTLVVQAQKKTVAVEVKKEENIDKSMSEAFRDVLQEGIYKSRLYDVFAREEDMEMVQQEAVFQMNATDEEIAKWGEALGADCVCYASIKKIASNYQISCKLVEANLSHKLLFIESVRIKGEDGWNNVLEFIANEMFSGRSGKATMPCPGCCKDGDCEISISDEKAASYEEANKICEDKGEGWSLPGKEELLTIYGKKIEIAKNGKNFKSEDYWSASYRNNYEAYAINFSNGKELFYSKHEKNIFRCILKK